MVRYLMIGMAVLAVLFGACKGGGTKAQTFGVMVDGKSAELLASYLAYFPNNVEVHPGDTVEFTSVFTGEPHTVTLGKDVDDIFNLIARACPNGGLADPKCQEGPPAEYADQYNAADGKLPQFLPEETSDVGQEAAQPCYLASGSAPSDGSACTSAQQQQNDFDGTQTYYNSGFLPDKTVFTVKLAKDIAPGTYNYFCLLHRQGMSGKITVVDKKTKVSSPSDVKKAGDDQFSATVGKLKAASDGLKSLKADTAQAGGLVNDVPEAVIDEFGPGSITIPAGGSVTWTFQGPHTVSFNPPDDAKTIVTKGNDGAYHVVEKAFAPAGGPGAGNSPGLIDAGSWDGIGFLSSGVVLSFPPTFSSYKVTFTKAGTYNYVCLIHPGMVGSVTVQ